MKSTNRLSQILPLLLFVLLTTLANAQQVKVGFKQVKTTVYKTYKDKTTITIPLEQETDNRLDSEAAITVNTGRKEGISDKDFTVETRTVLVDGIRQANVVITIYDTTKGEHLLELFITTKDRRLEITSSHHIIEIKEKPAEEKAEETGDTIQMRYVLGTNLDFLNPQVVKGFYFNVGYFNPKISPVLKKFYWGIMIGGFSSRSFSKDSNNNYRSANTVRFIPQRTDSAASINYSYNAKSTTTTENINLYFAPHISLWPSPSKKGKGNYSLFFNGHLEYLYRKIRTDYEYTFNSTDTMMVARTPGMTQSGRNFDIRTFETIERSGYFGAGFMFTADTKNLSLYLKYNIGFCSVNIPFIQGNWRKYYLFQFGYIHKSVGIQLFTDIRGFFPAEPPFVTIGIGKTINIDALLK